MIVEAAENVISLVEELEQKKHSKNLNDSMAQTRSALVQLERKAIALADFIQFNHNRITGNNHERLVASLTNLLKELQLSRKQFKDERRQVSHLQLIGNNLDRIQKDAEAAWSDAFQKEMEPLFRATDLAGKLLPDGAQQWIKPLQEEISVYFSRPPKTRNDMVIMVGKVEKLRKYTEGGVSIYGPSVTNFLAKVEKEIATIADLDDEVDEWIKQQKLQKKFKITFNK